MTQKIETSEHFQSITLLTQPKAESFFFQSRTTSRKLSIGNPMEDFRLLVTKKKQFEVQDFTMSIAGFGWIGESEFKSRTEVYHCAFQSVCWSVKDLIDILMEQIKTELVWIKTPVEYRENILIISTPWKFQRVQILVWWSKLLVFQSNLPLQT